MLLAISVRGIAQTGDSSENVIAKASNDQSMVIYPMPVHGDAFRISGINTLKINGIQVFDISGRLVGEIHQSEINENGEISVDHFNEGTYVLLINLDRSIINKKIIIS